MTTCPHCKARFIGSHHCHAVNRTVSSLEAQAPDMTSTIVSAAVAAATDNAVLGGLVGGSMMGGIVGDLLDGDLMD